MSERLAPGSTIGILGGGQLGRMLSLAASRLGLNCHIYEPGSDCPASQVSNKTTTASYGNDAALEAFAKSVDVVTFEFENIPDATLDVIAEFAPVHPNRKSLSTSQDRVAEKDFLCGLGLSTAPYAAVDNVSDLEQAYESIGLPAILKTRRFGYDGKGQVRIKDLTNLPEAEEVLKSGPCVLEGFVDFDREISVIGARDSEGRISCFDPGENVHKDGILHTTTIPAAIPKSLEADAVLLAGRILNALDYVGVLGVELFVTKNHSRTDSGTQTSS